MNTIIKSTIAVCGFLAAVSAPLIAGADTFTFSSKGATGDMSGSNGNLDLWVTASENTSQSKSNKSGSSGAYVSGNYYTLSECWYGYGSADTISFKSTKGPVVPKNVTASGTISVTWYEYCGTNQVIPDTVTFNENLTAMGNQAYSSWGTNHYEYGNIKENNHSDYSSAPASVGASSITSQYFGAVVVNGGTVSQSKSHDVQITK